MRGTHPVTRLEAVFEDAVARDPKQFIAAHARMQQRLADEGVYFGDDGKLLPTALKPQFLPKAIEDRWSKSVEELVAVLEILVDKLLDEPAQVDRLRLTPEALALFRIDPGYRHSVVSCRPDMLFDGDRAGIVEINTDSPAMFTFTDVVQRLMLDSYPLNGLASAATVPWQRTRDLLNAMLACYREAGGSKREPAIAIVDWEGGMTRFEQATTARMFTALGAPTRVCDPRSLKLANGALTHADGEPIDIVQRRVLFPDFLKRKAGLEPLLQAYRERSVCVVNPLRSYLVGNKSLLALLRTPWAEATLGKRAVVDELVPETLFVTPADAPRIAAERAGWVLKRAFGYGGTDVVLGSDVDDTVWKDAVAKATTEPWIAQRRLAIPSYRLPVIRGDEVRFEDRYINWNPWVFGGKFAGATGRTSTSAIISITQGGAVLPSVGADEP